MEDIKITGQVGGKIKDEELEKRFKNFLKQMKVARGLDTFEDQMRAMLDEVDKGTLMSELSYGSHLKHLNQLTTQISDVFVSLAKQNETDKISREREIEKILENKDKEINLAKEAFENINNQLDKTKQEYERLETELKDFKKDFKELNDKIPNLEKTISDKESIITGKDIEIERLKSDVTKNNETISNQAQKIDSMTDSISRYEDLQEKVVSLEAANEKLVIDHENEKEKMQFDFDKQLFEKEKELEVKYRIEIEKITDKLTDKQQERLDTIADKHEARVNELLEEISKLRLVTQERDELKKEVEKLRNQKRR